MAKFIEDLGLNPKSTSEKIYFENIKCKFPNGEIKELSTIVFKIK